MDDAERLRELNLPDLWDLSRSKGSLYQKVVGNGAQRAPIEEVDPGQTPRVRFLATAGELFAKYGYPNVTLEQIQLTAQLSRASMMHLCVSKEDAFHQVLTAQVDAFVTESLTWINPQVSALDLVRLVAEKSFKYLPTKPLLLQLLLGLWVESMPTWGERLAHLREWCTTGFAKALETGIAQGVFRAEINVAMIANLLLDLHAASYLFADSSTPARVIQRRNAALDLIFHGLCRAR